MKTKTDEISDIVLAISKKFKQKLSCGVIDLAPNLSLKDISLIELIGTSKKTMGEIATEVNLTPGTITPIVDRLVKLKYLRRERDEKLDRRKIFITLDKKGEKIDQILLKERLKLSRAILKDLDEIEQDIVLELFNKILLNLEND